MRIGRVAVVCLWAVAGATACDDGPPPDHDTSASEVLADPTIARGSTWRYWDRGGDLGTAWAATAWDASSWASGAGPLGYGEPYLQTTIGYGPNAANKYVTTYFRAQFDVADPTQVTQLLGEVMSDDGIVVYLNGTRIGSDFMPSGPSTAATYARTHEANNTYVSYDWSAQRPLLVAGVNTIAVEVHQDDAGSSDLVFDLSLAVRTAAPPPPPSGEDIARRATWSYWDRGGDLGTAWRSAASSDATWARGAGPLGYGESYVATTIGYGPSASNKHRTTYFRGRFTVADPAAVTSLIGEVMYDDGAVVYLNGHEVARLAMPAGTITAATYAPGHETGNAYERFDWSAARGFLVTGENLVAVEVHQAAASSSDLAFDLALDVTTGGVPPPAAEGFARRSAWRVQARANQQPGAWRDRGFDDTSWPALPAPIGYGEPYVQSTITYGPDASHKWVTTYFRKTFTVSDPTAVSAMTGELMYDDGAVLYVNGREIARRGVPGTGAPAWGAFAATREANNAYEAIDLGSARPYLVPGVNVVAVEVHQDDAASSDLVFDLAVRLTVAATPHIAGCAPATPPTPALYPGGAFHHVWVAPGGAVWTTGDPGLIGRRSTDGTWAWCQPSIDADWGGVWGTADDDVWITGSAGLVRWNGSGFASVDVGTTAALHDIWGSSGANVFVVGDDGVVRRFDGSTWQVLDVAGNVWGVWGANATDVWMTAHACHPQATDPDENICGIHIYRWNAATSTFTLEDAFPQSHGSISLADISGSGPDDVWIVGQDTTSGAASTQAFAAHYDGTAWTSVQVPLHPDDSEFTAVAARAPGAESGAWLLVEKEPARRFDGATWSLGPAVTDSLFDVDVRGATMFAVGDFFHVVRWSPAGWVRDY